VIGCERHGRVDCVDCFMAVCAPVNFQFTVPGRPTGKARARIVKGRAYTPRETELAENEIRRAWQGIGAPRLEGPICLQVGLCVTRPRGHFNSKGELNAEGRRHPRPSRQKPDVDNALKLVMDALNTRAWHDDVQITDASVYRVWDEKDQTLIFAEERA
jgi:Holliday junction resolvase RusA-like endonuclease